MHSTKPLPLTPTRADAYYWKASNWSAWPPQTPGKIERSSKERPRHYQKYIELQPSGPHADEAKQMLTALNQRSRPPTARRALKRSHNVGFKV